MLRLSEDFCTTLYRYLLFSLLMLPSVTLAQSLPARSYYQEPKWKPRAILPYADAIRNDFWPASPKVEVSYLDPGFAEHRLSSVPAPGVYPRVLMTTDDVDRVRQKVAMGEQAPLAFRVMWQRVAASKSAFYALVTGNDSLGRVLAKDLVGKARLLIAKIAELDKRIDRDNLWNVERSIVAEGNPDPPTEIWDLLQYDYLHKWMTPEERELMRTVIASVTRERISNFLHVPDHFMINNHEEFGMEYIRLMLLIEGQPGFDQALFDASVHKVRALLDWFLSKDGMCYESIKGWLNISAFVAVGLRDRTLLRHDHLRAKMRFFQAAIRWENGAWRIRDEMRASAFHVIWMMHYYHPEDKGLDFLYQSTFSTHPFLTDVKEKWPDPVGICHELLLLFADDGIMEKGSKIDWTRQENIDKLKLPVNWSDNQRGYIDVRNSWRKDDLHVQFMCKQDFFYGGHEGSENNRIVLWKDGVNWIRDNDMLAHKATFLQNMLTVDGKGQRWPPAPGNWLGAQESDHGVLAAGDGRIGYSYSKVMQIHPFSFPSVRTGYLAPFAEGNVDMGRDIQIAFQPATIAYYDGYGHTDYGPWSGETRLIEGYRPYNPMEQAFRTVHIAKGKHPYVLVFDDARKDDSVHQFSFNLSVPPDAVLIEASTPEIVFQQTDPSLQRMSDLIIGRNGISRDPITGKYTPKKGDPLCLIRVLWRNTKFGFPVPRLEFMQGHALVTIPAIAISPEYRMLIYPYKFGDPLPKTGWNADRSELDVQIAEQSDKYLLATTEAGRTVMTMLREDKPVLNSRSAPARPDVLVRGETYTASAYRYTRYEHKIPTYLLYDSLNVSFAPVPYPARVLYTLDGSEPNEGSAVFTKPIRIKKAGVIKARTFHPTWTQGQNWSETVTVSIVKPAVRPARMSEANASTGLNVSVYEIDTKMYDDKGFFRADLSMMPDLDLYKPSVSTSVPELSIPLVTPSAPFLEQRKGFYRFNGELFVAQCGVYRFDLESCGPVTLDIGGSSVIESTGVFHQQLTHRKGEAVLKKGWNKFELVVCDPLFWNINSQPPMPCTLTMAYEDGAYREIPAVHFRKASGTTTLPADRKWFSATALPEKTEPGTVLRLFDQVGKRRSVDFLDIDTATPFFTSKADRLEASSQRETVRVYDGYLFIPEDGRYQFKMPFREGENAWLGSNQASCQSQLRIDGQVILQRGVPGRNLDGYALLRQGWHALSLRFGTGSSACIMVTPDKRSIPIRAELLKRPSTVPGGFATGEGSLGRVDFGSLTESAAKANYKIWTGHHTSLKQENGGKILSMPKVEASLLYVDINVARGGGPKAGFKVYGMRLRENVLSVALWFRSFEKDGKILSKEGINAFGKSYRTLSATLAGGRLNVMPGRLSVGGIEPGKWYFLVISASEQEVSLYLDGKRVAFGPGTRDIGTDALDFFTGHHAEARSVELFDRILDQEAVDKLYQRIRMPY